MAALTSALDEFNKIQIGENGTIEYGWSDEVQELIVQFHFQLVRKANLNELSIIYEKILKKIFSNSYNINFDYLKIMYKLVAYTRDIVYGKGEYELAYMMITELYKFGDKNEGEKFKNNIQEMACQLLETFVNLNNEHPYGSWKDLKYFSNYYVVEGMRNDENLLNDKLINTILNLICNQVRKDVNNNNNEKSLVGKWIPREKSSKFGWLTTLIARHYYQEWFSQSLTPSQHKSATRKALTHFRKIISALNKELNTPQINQCSGTWRNINFNKNVTSITMRKQSKAFSSETNGKIKNKVINNKDRLECRDNYKNYINDCKIGVKKIKSKRISILDFVRDGLKLTYPFNNLNNESEREILDMQWKENSKQTKKLGNMIAMVDTSGSMESDNCIPLHSAIGLGIRIAENSKLGKRIITFSSSPEWINLDGSKDFIDMLEKVKRAPWGTNTNFMEAFDMILNIAISENISPFEMKNFTLVVLSDMQIDYSGNINQTMFDKMKSKYAEAGLKTKFQTPYELPHIVFWNLRQTSGFPVLSSTKNTSMLSGYSASVMNAFSDKGVEALEKITPWDMINSELSKERYSYLDKIMDSIWKNDEKKRKLEDREVSFV
tara:strand:- start:1447 stop:3270 length:1824 start_codon:yes stop_codon:yes gene_type:complete